MDTINIELPIQYKKDFPFLQADLQRENFPGLRPDRIHPWKNAHFLKESHVTFSLKEEN
jgi:hypothetical protein